MVFDELNSDQRREAINTAQRFAAWRDAQTRVRACRGSMVWSASKGRDYLIRASYAKNGRRRQSSLGVRTAETERMKAEFDRARSEAEARVAALKPVMDRQAAINRALGLGRVPLLGARIIRTIDTNGLLGSGIRVLGTYALYAYEAAAGVRIEPGLTTSDDIDLLLDSRGGLSFFATEEIEEASLLRILRRVDKSFERTRQSFRAVNKDGYMVDLIKPMRSPPWKADVAAIGQDPEDLSAVEIVGLEWHESAPIFDAVAIDDRGEPLRIVTSDPRVFAIHKLWLSHRDDREPVRRRRDRDQAEAVAALVLSHLQHLPFERKSLRMLPADLVAEAEALWSSDRARSGSDRPGVSTD